ncbi:glycoside hydrolase family 99-like domain-containing protein [Palaeococcus ferrophilus]|uniref:glycoside hydrolase family 99-like domain-containing protein n=1 Tax=Palaeococcus ferrophilus TaxID=83868 RepID=UPI0012F94753
MYQKNFSSEERLIFINAWDEWGEEGYLGLDRKFGYAHLIQHMKPLLGNRLSNAQRLEGRISSYKTF